MTLWKALDFSRMNTVASSGLHARQEASSNWCLCHTKDLGSSALKLQGVNEKTTIILPVKKRTLPGNEHVPPKVDLEVKNQILN